MSIVKGQAMLTSDSKASFYRRCGEIEKSMGLSALRVHASNLHNDMIENINKLEKLLEESEAAYRREKDRADKLENALDQISFVVALAEKNTQIK